MGHRTLLTYIWEPEPSFRLQKPLEEPSLGDAALFPSQQPLTSQKQDL